MDSQFTPMSYHSVEFAKAYRAEQARAAGRARLAAALRASRRGSRMHRAWTAMVAHARKTMPGTVARQTANRALER